MGRGGTQTGALGRLGRRCRSANAGGGLDGARWTLDTEKVQEGRQTERLECGEQQRAGKRAIGHLFLEWLAANLNHIPAIARPHIVERGLLREQRIVDL